MANAFNRLIDRATQKNWTRDDIAEMVGDARQAYLVHATDETTRSEAASGGATSALLIHGLETGKIDGAVICKTVVVDGKVRAKFDIARTREEILAARGSKYVETRFLAEALPLIRSFAGKLAVCGLPCDIANLRRWEAKDPEIARKIVFRIAFFCGHNSRKELVDGVTRKLSREAHGGALTDFQFRSGQWRGELTARFDNGEVLKKPFSYFSDYRNLGFFSERKCMACTDHFGYAADFSVGDLWLYKLKDEKIKKSGVLTRSAAAEEFLQQASDAGAIATRPIDARTILDGQSRIAPTHYNITARVKAGKLLGVKLNDTIGAPAPLHKRLSAFIGLANLKWSEGRKSDWVFAMPRGVIRAYLFFKKGLESLP